MNKLKYVFLLVPTLVLSQIQIGSDINGKAPNDLLGASTALSSNGNIVAVGAPSEDTNPSHSGYVSVYQNLSGIWTQIGSDINGDIVGDLFGESISLSSDGNILAISANNGNNNFSGYVRVYENLSGIWTQIGSDINGDEANDTFGNSISLSSNGNILAIGAINNDNGSFTEIDFGRVKIYENQLGTWVQIGQNIDGEDELDLFGQSVSLSSDGSVIAIGADLGNSDDSGYVRVYENVSGTWTQIGSDINGEAVDDFSGNSVSLSSNGKIVAIGASENDGNGSDSGHVRVYENIGGVWKKIGNDIDGEAADDQFGHSVSLSADGSIIAIGAIFNSGSMIESGHVRIYKNNNGTWTKIGIDINGDATEDFLGASVSLSSNGTKLAIGADYNDGGGLDSGHVKVYDLSALLSSDEFILTQFSLSPNPVKDILNIKLNISLELQEVKIYNQLGQFVKTETKNKVNISKLSKGMYYVQVITNQGKATKKIVIE